jgi:hypothetical protein
MNDSHTTYASVGAGASVAVCLSWLVKALLHVDMPSEVAVSMASMISMGAGYFFHQFLAKGAIK